jgi:hypothetical protein
MPLKKIPLKAGFNKQDTATAAEGQWIDGDFVRFRYGYPEKIGGWQELLNKELAGVARAQHTWTDLSGNKYAAIGTNKLLVIYFEGAYYDITPLGTTLTSATYSSTTSSATVTITKSSHGLSVGDYIKFTAATTPGPTTTSYTAANFTTNIFEVRTVPNVNTFTLTMPVVETGTGVTTAGSLSFAAYANIGPISQTYGYGWGTATWGSFSPGGVNWGEASSSATVVLSPGNWSFDNFGQILVATIKDGKTFSWNPSTAGALNIRATVIAGAPTASVMSIVSDRDRHLIALGTETTIGNTATQDPMFIRFSNQEDYNTWAPTATNTAGTFRLDTGNYIVGAVQGKDYIFILTDQAAYVMQFVGPPFVFSIRQVGTNCGCIGQHSIVFAQGAIFWMGFGGGFFVYDGTVKQLPSLVEDFVFTTGGDNLGINYNAADIVYGSHNSLYNEVIWFYPTANESQINRSVVYNFVENTWTTMSLSRTTYSDAQTYDKPYATKYLATGTPTFPTINGVTNTYGSSDYYEHEVGVNEVSFTGVKTAIPAYIESGDFDLDIEGDGQYLMKINRFIPDFKILTGNAKVTLLLRNYPSQTQDSQMLGPYTVTSSTTKIDTRARNRLMSIKVENESTDENWRYGLFRVDIQPDGRR